MSEGGTIKRDAKHGKLAVQEKIRQDAKRDENITTSFAAVNLRSIIRKMKITLLVLCLALVYTGSCKEYGEKDVNLIEELTNDRNYGLDYPDASFEKALSRHKRAILLSPIQLVLKALGLNGISSISNMLKTAVDMMGFALRALNGEECPKIGKISIRSFETSIPSPIKVFETLVCYCLQKIGATNRAIAVKLLDLLSQFIWKTFLPGLHRILNNKTVKTMLPPSLRVMVEGFNAFYTLMKFMGKVE